MTYQSILLIGCGNMAGAMVEGWLADGITPQSFTVFDPYPRPMADGITVLSEMPNSGQFDAILLGVKPQMLAEIVPAVEPLAGPDTLILSILAGVELGTLARHFPRSAGQVRVMPNLAVSLGKAPVALAGNGLPQSQQDDLTRLMDPLGSPEWIDESDFDLVTALAGSGPGFVYRFIGALGDAAAKLGLPREQAMRLAIAMVEGAAALAAASPDDPGALADRVASPGGVTREGLNVLDENDAMLRLMEECLRRARDKSAQMAAEARK